MFGKNVKVERALLSRAERCARIAGYASVDEFVAHAIEPLLSSDIFLQSDSCYYLSSGNTTISQLTLTVGKVKVQETLCPKDLETKYTQKALNAVKLSTWVFSPSKFVLKKQVTSLKSLTTAFKAKFGDQYIRSE